MEHSLVARGAYNPKVEGSNPSQDNEGAASRDTPGARGELPGVRGGQYLALENVVGNVDTHEQSCVKDDLSVAKS